MIPVSSPAYVFPRVIGHRGACALAPENTLASIRRAAIDGAGMVELDVRLTADGRCVLLHDDTLDRTTDGCGPVSLACLDHLSALDAGLWFSSDFRGESVPTLEETIDLLLELGVGLNLELKPSPGYEADMVRAVVSVLESMWPSDRLLPLLSSFDCTILEYASDLAPSWPLGLIADRLPDDWLALARDLGLKSVNLGHEGLDMATVQAVRKAGYEVAIWTVNDPVRAQELLCSGVSAIISDDPGTLLRAGVGVKG
ncbi:glycerophosphoryl diester phosphodiesterase [Haematospirillum sp. H1815]|uniref:glycerophosphoryl diester phosphodiesterase n=1 Tax=Haematospirillum sp. H1815 TaxID=2723108 RepID=UPI001438AE91|nr:glycerophosphoryl diester phosphodiesterase [Haematospirillum sp. H1815]NKD77755.1 glycerophosphoryl diester phosphodiesterase [Haematospirillum sp. H1815]